VQAKSLGLTSLNELEHANKLIFKTANNQSFSLNELEREIESTPSDGFSKKCQYVDFFTLNKIFRYSNGREDVFIPKLHKLMSIYSNFSNFWTEFSKIKIFKISIFLDFLRKLDFCIY
jgi:hypothetical protein